MNGRKRSNARSFCNMLAPLNTTHYCRNFKGLFKNYKAFFHCKHEYGSKKVIFLLGKGRNMYLGEGFMYLKKHWKIVDMFIGQRVMRQIYVNLTKL